MKHPELHAGASGWWHHLNAIFRTDPAGPEVAWPAGPLAADTRQAGPGWTTLTVSRWIGLRHASEV